MAYLSSNGPLLCHFRRLVKTRSHHLFFISTLLLLSLSCVECIGEVIYAVNCGGGAHTDLDGVHYKADKLSVGTPSDFGKTLNEIDRASPADQVLYQTERYHVGDFGYTIPIKEDGDFVLVLKFCEVYFRKSRLKVFHVRLNRQHMVIKDLDIYDRVGYGVAHDEHIPFTLRNGLLKIGPHSSPFSGKLHVEFVKTHYDNPKVNAIVVFKGKVEDFQQLQPEKEEEKHEDEEEKDEEAEDVEAPIHEKKHRKTSGPKVQDPYETEDSGIYFYPLVIAVGLLIPTILCLCKL